MNALLELSDLACRLAHQDPPRTVVAFERRARAETLVVCSVALLGLLSVLVSLARVGGLEASEAAAAPGSLAATREAEVTLDAVREQAPAASAGAEECEELPALSGARIARRDEWTEREFRAEYLALASAEELAARVSAALDLQACRAEMLAGLQVLVMRESPAAAALAVRAAHELELRSDALGESVPRAFVAWLERMGPRSATARGVLESMAGDGSIETQLRAAALRAWIAALPEDELGIAASRFGREADDTVYASALSSLELRRSDSHGERRE